MFSQIRTRVIIQQHETPNPAPCLAAVAEEVPYIVSVTTRYRLFGRLERIPTQIMLMDIVNRPLLTRERR
jgi:hypothetical protein